MTKLKEFEKKKELFLKQDVMDGDDIGGLPAMAAVVFRTWAGKDWVPAGGEGQKNMNIMMLQFLLYFLLTWDHIV